MQHNERQHFLVEHIDKRSAIDFILTVSRGRRERVAKLRLANHHGTTPEGEAVIA
jgi:hypothetical protein